MIPHEHPLRLNLGCYTSYLLSWVNVDIDPTVKADQRWDLTEPLPLPDQCVYEVLLAHVIEHLMYCQGQALLDEIYRVLRSDGLLRLSTPNLSYVLDHLDQLGSEDPIMRREYVYGLETNQWQKHYSLYTLEMLLNRLTSFRKVEEEYVWHEIRLNAWK